MKKLLLLVFSVISISAFSQTKVKINQQETVELFPHTIDAGAGTEGSPYTNSDNTGGIQTEINALAAGRGGSVKLAASRFNVTTPITITSNSIKLESVVPGYNADPNAQSQGINGASLIITGSAISISGTGYPVGRTAGVQLSGLYLFGTTTRQAIGSSTGTVGVQLNSFIDQPTLRNVNMGGFDYGIKSVNSVSGWVDFAYFQQIEIQGGRVGVYYDNAGAGNFGQHYVACAIAETDEHNVYVSSSTTNENFVFSATAFYRGSSAAGVTNPANVYFAGTKSRFDGCEFAQAGYNLIAGTHRQADGLYLAGDYNTVTGCAFLDNITSGSAGIRITGNNNIVSGCVFNNNAADIVITGNNNIVYVSGSTVVTDSGTGNTIISNHMTLKPVVSSNSVAQGLTLSPTLTPTQNGTSLIGMDISTTYAGPLKTVTILSGGSSYTNGTYTSVPVTSTGGTGGLATVVVSGAAITSITVTTAGTGYIIANTVTIAAGSIGGTGSGLTAYVTALNFTAADFAPLRVDGLSIGRGAGAGILFNNIAIGPNALLNNTIGGSGGANVAIGSNAMKATTTASQNTAVGVSALTANTTGGTNTVVGASAGVAVTTGSANTAVGSGALTTLSTNIRNTAVGVSALFNSIADSNTGLGWSAGGNVTTGSTNTFVGGFSGAGGMGTGSGNVVIGWNCGGAITSGSNNTLIGANLAGLSSALSNNIILSDGASNMRIVVNSSGNGYFGATTTYPTIGTDKFEIAGSVKSTKVNIGTASNQGAGTATLSSGTVTVSNTAVTASSIILLTYNTPSGTIGILAKGTIVAGTSFVINSLQAGTASTLNAADNSSVAYVIIN